MVKLSQKGQEGRIKSISVLISLTACGRSGTEDILKDLPQLISKPQFPGLQRTYFYVGVGACLQHLHHKYTSTSFTEPEGSGLERNLHITWSSVLSLKWILTSIGHYPCHEQEFSSFKSSNSGFGQISSKFFTFLNQTLFSSNFLPALMVFVSWNLLQIVLLWMYYFSIIS